MDVNTLDALRARAQLFLDVQTERLSSGKRKKDPHTIHGHSNQAVDTRPSHMNTQKKCQSLMRGGTPGHRGLQVWPRADLHARQGGQERSQLRPKAPRHSSARRRPTARWFALTLERKADAVVAHRSAAPQASGRYQPRHTPPAQPVIPRPTPQRHTKAKS